MTPFWYNLHSKS